ncbi:acyltransferase [Caulobacter sp. S45]|uniref:acyltransferase family protein n=1 Tax=Caulobacter sp. S45 TaxID=1641861 RepID=UPI00131E1BE5|nr:acyltransferase [Caulobacter sp. S45]
MAIHRALRGGPDPIRAPRMPGLDLLRAVAIVWVMLYHASLFDLVSYSSKVVQFGWMGVDLFFVLSGFLIGGQIFRPIEHGERLDVRRFYLRRALRTLPAYLVVVGVYFAWPRAREWPDIQPLWQFLIFTENLLIDFSVPKSFSHVWSLCVEEQFYLLLPPVVAPLLLRPNYQRVIAACLLVLVGGMVLRGYIWWHDLAPHLPGGAVGHGYGDLYMERIYYPTWTRLDGLLAGVVAALLRAFRPRLWAAAMKRANLMLAVGCVGVVACILFFRHQIPTLLPAVFGYPLLSLSLGLVVSAGSSPRGLLGRRALPGAGALAAGAYSLYLSHKLVFHFIQVHGGALVGANPYVRFVAAFALAGAVGALLYWGVERPFLKLRDRLDGPARSLLALPSVQAAE